MSIHLVDMPIVRFHPLVTILDDGIQLPLKDREDNPSRSSTAKKQQNSANNNSKNKKNINKKCKQNISRGKKKGKKS